MIPFGQFNILVHTGLNIIHYTAQVAVGNIGRDYDFSLHVLAADRIRSHGRTHFCDVVQRYFLSVTGIYHQVAYLLHFVAKIITYTYGKVEAFTFLVYL